MAASTPASTDIGEHSSIPISHCLTFGAGLGPTTTKGRLGKQPIIFSSKRGRGH